MKHKAVYLLPLTTIFILLFFSFNSCSDMTYQPPGDYISGWATINDTNLLPGGYYAISMYANRNNAFDTLPLRSDSLKLERFNDTYRFFYRVSAVPNGSYYFAVTWIQYPVHPYGRMPVLGTWRCDTAHNCTDHQLISFPNYTGAAYNILAWGDTAQQLN